MVQWVIPPRPHTRLDQVRETLDEIEARLPNLRGTGPKAIELLLLFDQVAETLDRLEEAGADVRAERGRLDSAWRTLRRRARVFLKEVGTDLRERREQQKEARLRPWWFLDHIHAREQRRGLLRKGLFGLIGGILLVLGWVGYERFLAPPEEVRQALRHAEEGQSWLEQGDLERALAEFEAAAALTPDDPEMWLWVGVLRQRLGDEGGAEAAFRKARNQGLAEWEFRFQRGTLLLQIGDLEAALIDAESAIELAPDWGYGYYLRASVRAMKGDIEAALIDYQQAADLAHAAEDTQLEAMARTQMALLLQYQGP
ncbi:MAG TPA: tetratricopeptide repeat protein [Thermoflexia bacterium]|jgi:tetratricopeptide (TPR) repeat protein|nr:tetratricopeptide repeat protein [Thermoflexia bacterium]